MDKIRIKIKESNDRLKISSKSALLVDAGYLSGFGLQEVQLRPYQIEGVQWMVDRYEANLGCILADEMGLGKTCQTISFLVYVLGRKPTQKMSLILAPLSVISNWKNELTRFAPKLQYVTYIGNQDERATLQNEIGNGHSVRVVLTSYEICLRDKDYLCGLNWNVLVVDEAHRLKNHNSQLYQTLLEFDFEHRVLLTGTPVQNNLRELYSLLSFISSGIFKERFADEFVESFKDVSTDTTGQSAELSQVLQPFILRRIKTEVLKDLPKKSEVVLYHGMSALQKKYYKAILSKDIGAFDTSTYGKPNKTRLNNVLMQLRKCVSHPYLFDGVEPEPFELGDHLIDASGKLTVLDQLLTYLKDAGHKVLLFSQMTRVLDIIQDYLGYRGYTYERLDGSVRAEERFLAVRNFNRDTSTFVFLLSTRAGGQGLNLISADTVIIVDSDFNPQNDLQAAARAHRIGQKRNVKVIRLIARSTVEEIILKRSEDKLRLTNAVIVPGQFNSRGAVDDEQFKIEDILKFGLDKLFENEDSTLEDIDFTAILGPSIDGVWQQDVIVKDNEATSSVSECADVDVNDDKLTIKTQPAESMYVFEGTDYSKEPSAADCQIFQKLLDAEKAKTNELSEAGRTSRKNQGIRLTEALFSELPTKTRKPRKQLTPEELEQRRIKRAEAAARRAKEEEEEEVRKEQHRKQKRESFWKSNAYETYAVHSESDDEGSDTESLEEVGEEEGEISRAINYVVGDVTHPVKTGDSDAIVVHCVDNSGRWGKGGLFTSIDCRSLLPQKQYQLAGKMKDLALGDLHLVPIDDVQSRSNGNDFLGLIVAQKRDERNNLSGIKLAALRRAFEKLYSIAKTKKATVHLPRLGHNTPGFNWYGTERLIRKCLTSRGIPTFIYYYPRKQAAKRKSESTASESSSKVPCPTKSPAVIDEDSSSGDHLSNIMHGVSVYFNNVSEEAMKQAKRYVIAYDGDVHDELRSTTTHVIVEKHDGFSETDIEDIKSTCPGAKIIVTEWIFDSVRKQQQVALDNYVVSFSQNINDVKDKDSTSNT